MSHCWCDRTDYAGGGLRIDATAAR